MAECTDISGAPERATKENTFNAFFTQVIGRLNKDQLNLIKLLRDNGYVLDLLSVEVNDRMTMDHTNTKAVITFEHNYIHSEITLRF